jgi:alpha-tubulin suppressor-like RCC1 family protein
MDVYTWGSNKYKQISQKQQLHIYAPTQQTVFSGQSVSQVATGDYHSLILTDYGDIYTLGRGREGQLGIGRKCLESDMQLVSALSHETIVDIACGSQASYAVTSNGQLYQW